MSEASVQISTLRPPPEKLPGGSPRASFPEDPVGYMGAVGPWMSREGFARINGY